MTAADVAFLDKGGRPCPDGERPAYFSFRCVGHNRGQPPALQRNRCEMLLIAMGPHSAAHGIKRDPQGNNGGRPQWEWDGNRESPTFQPSINCEKHCGWHGYIRNGRCVNTQGQDEPA